MLKYIYTRITGNDLIIDEITNALELTPAFSYKKGETKITEFGENVVYIEDCWQHEILVKAKTELNALLLKHLRFLADKNNIFEVYKKKHKVQLGIMLYYDDYQNTIIFSQEISKMLAKLDIDFYVTISNL